MDPRKRIAAVVLAAGRSVRFRSSTSKLTHGLGGRPILQWTLSALRGLPIDRTVVVVGFDVEHIKELCGPGVQFARQAEPRGTGHAVLASARLLRDFDGEVLILNGDLPMLRPETLRRIVETHQDSRAQLTLATAVVPNPHGWGRVVRRDGAVECIVEEKDATTEQRSIKEVNVGLYCVSAGILFRILRRVRPDNVQQEIYLTDLVDHARRDGIRVLGIQIGADEVAQINSRAELANMEKTLRDRINAGWMEQGVTLQDPETAYVEPEVIIGRDTFIGPNVHLRGRTRIGQGCRIDGSAFLTDATVGDKAHVRFGVVITESEIGPRCEIGPFANLRPATRLAAEVHIGDFVETKNAVIGPRTKANHLAYLGDTEIGCDTNIGAGTITCNYDGFHKHRTVIGDRVQVGSDSQLVAPVTLADDVYVGTGTTVRRDVPAGALVVNPKEDMHRLGWVEGFRDRAARAPKKTTAARPKSRAKRPASKAKSSKTPAAGRRKRG